MTRRRPPLTVEQILAWADAHHACTGEWPTTGSGPVPEAPGEVWRYIDAALYQGARGLPRGGRLARLLARHRGHDPGRPHQPLWTVAEDELVRTLPPREAAERTGRTLAAVYQRRHLLGVGLPPRPQG
jgi:hypothetical protein